MFDHCRISEISHLHPPQLSPSAPEINKIYQHLAESIALLGDRKWLNTSAHVLAWSVIPLLHLMTIHLLTASHQNAPASATDWFNKGHAKYYHVYGIMHVKDP